MKCPLCHNVKSKKKQLGKYVLNICPECHLKYVKDFGNEYEYHNNYFEKFRSSPSDKNKLREQQYFIDAEHFRSWIPRGTVLDIGCSTGRFIQLLDHSKTYKQLIGIDIDDSAIEVAQNNVANNSISFFNTSLTEFSTNKKFNGVVFRGTLQYMSAGLESAMLKLKNIVKKNGFIIVYSLPNADSFVFNLVGENWSLFNPQEHKLFFNSNSLVYLARKYDFRIMEMTFPYINTPYANLENDYRTIKKIIKNNIKASPPFWGNIIQLVLKNI